MELIGDLHASSSEQTLRSALPKTVVFERLYENTNAALSASW